ncbi:uncharacterized protein PITG_11708 [Phytophthora infestans T30-4]|uniref:Uncharacterized protein n=1 Tax=Phytophthora infestans (strain T30-4) TaxID=403677 RepID=D0NID5_PHYIT|nr:uncharacterized protein PITG_11708 [Phytophthora infestans T30-4]EEY59220.1 conserved hypothetical protein [Phytophthora infestans T30-4]|eukprot:XP_002901234.1 conserved hypothetical protein [Phytophthora infestans T30-4]
MWARLIASGWTHKKPPASCIETRWKFIPPRGKASGVEGKDYFLDLDRVLAHYAAGHVTRGDGAGLTAPVDESEAPNVNPSLPVSPPAATPNLTASSPPTSREVNASDGDIGSGNGISSDDSVEDELKLVLRRTPPRPTAPTAQGTSLFGSSDEDDSGGEATVLDDDGEDPDSASEGIHVFIMYIEHADSEDDLNKIEGDNHDDFAGFESGNEIEEDGIVDEDDSDEEGEEDVAVIGRGSDDEEGDSEEEDPNSAESIAERHLAEYILMSLGGSDKFLAGTGISKQDLEKLREHSATGRTDPDMPGDHEFLQTPYQAMGRRIAILS